ncbi:MAG: hypothetical protein E4H16_05200 [Candidatus Atribacteria bacterium]|nr:MAG: hypothetical protein E4H16_05200 [Candidatus Atribacteria bacterium]
MKDKIFCINKAENLYRATPSRSILQAGSIRHDSAKNKNMKTGVKENWQAVYRQLSNEIKVRHYSPKTLKSYSTCRSFKSIRKRSKRCMIRILMRRYRK